MLIDEKISNLKKSIKGENNYLFLVNDSNNELKQHFDPSYENKFNKDIFLKQFNEKKTYCEENKIRYYFFLVPDKSLVCKNFLPFIPHYLKRNYNTIKDLPDFIDYLDYSCYFKNDSHINYEGGKKLSYYYLKYIDPDFDENIFKKLIDEQIISREIEHPGDLIMAKNWSYSDEEKDDFPNDKVIKYINKCLLLLNHKIPKRFEKSVRETVYYKNKQGLSNLKVLILRDSSINMLKDILSIYFNEILLYWGYWSFNKDLIEWYKPDIILEIKTERFLENQAFFLPNME